MWGWDGVVMEKKFHVYGVGMLCQFFAAKCMSLCCVIFYVVLLDMLACNHN